MAPESAFRQTLAFLFKRTLSFDHCLAKVLPGHPTPTGRTCPVKMPAGVRTQTKWSPGLRESTGTFNPDQDLGLTIAMVES